MIFQTENLAFRYPLNAANTFENINLHVRAGEILCILGPNGVGKSTLLRCLAGLASPGNGDVILDGRSLSLLSVRDRAKQIAFIPQQYQETFPFPVRTVIETGCTPYLPLFGMPDQATGEKVVKIAGTIGISHLLDKSFSEISGGEQQLVHIARALLQETAFIIMDEPTAHLDFANQARFLKLVRALSAKGVAVFFSTHMPEHAFNADHILLLHPQGSHVYGAAKDVMTQKQLSDAYGIEINIHKIGRHTLCIADADADADG